MSLETNPLQSAPRLAVDGFDVLDIVPIPLHADRMIRLRTLAEALEDFPDRAEAGVLGYFIQVRPKPKTAPAAATRPAPAAAPADPVYVDGGKLNLPYLVKTAELLERSGETTLARNIYQTMLQAGERTAHALQGIARCFRVEGRLEEAQSHFEQSIAYQPQLASYRAVASILVARGKHQQAAETLERALSLREPGEPGEPGAGAGIRYEMLKAAGNCWARAEKPVEAERAYQRALELRPEAAEAAEIWANLGALYLAYDDLDQAEAAFRRALELDPGFTRALDGLGYGRAARGDFSTASEYFARSLAREIRNPSAIHHLVSCAHKLQTYAPAAALLEKHVQAVPADASLLYALSGMQFHLHSHGEARATCLKVLELAPQHGGARELLGLIERNRSC